MKLARSKTLWFSAVVAAFGAAQTNLEAVRAVVSPEVYGWLTIGIAAGVAVLRAVTKTPLSEK